MGKLYKRKATYKFRDREGYMPSINVESQTIYAVLGLVQGFLLVASGLNAVCYTIIKASTNASFASMIHRYQTQLSEWRWQGSSYEPRASFSRMDNTPESMLVPITHHTGLSEYHLPVTP